MCGVLFNCLGDYYDDNKGALIFSINIIIIVSASASINMMGIVVISSGGGDSIIGIGALGGGKQMRPILFVRLL